MKETWKQITGWKGLYSISNSGNVLSHRTNKLMKPKVSKIGYHTIQMQRIENGRKVCSYQMAHRLVALNFIPNPHNRSDVNHIDGDKSNNEVNNLEWVTHSGNLIYYYNEIAKKPIDKIKRSSFFLSTESLAIVRKLADKQNVSPSVILDEIIKNSIIAK